MKPLFIAFEGIDGAGKNTQLAKTRTWLRRIGMPVRYSSEPNDGTNPIGQYIRAVLTHELAKPADPVEFQRMFVIDRAQDIFCLIRPAVESGYMYLIERYALSTIAYGMLSGLGPEVFIRLHEDVLGPSMVWPDLSVIVDVEPEEAIRRLNTSGANRQLFERLDFLTRVQKHYLELAEHSFFVGRVCVVNGGQPEDDVFKDIQQLIQRKLLAMKGEPG